MVIEHDASTEQYGTVRALSDLSPQRNTDGTFVGLAYRACARDALTNQPFRTLPFGPCNQCWRADCEQFLTEL